MLKLLFISISVLLGCAFVLYKLYLVKLKRTPKISAYVSAMAGLLLIYVLYSVFYLFFANSLLIKCILLFLAAVPFLIGKYVTYEKENFYSWLQIGIIFLGVVFVIIME